MRRSRLSGMAGIAILTIILGASFLAPLLTPADPSAVDLSQTLLPPSAGHLFGTDVLGRDMFSRILYGGRSSTLLALTATALSMAFGMAVGTAAGYYGGFLDEAVMTVINIFQGLPGTSLMIAIAGILGPSFKSLLLAMVIIGWTGFARIVRTEVMKIKTENFVEGLRCLGAGDFIIIFRHVIPNMKGNAIVLFTTRIGSSLLSISSLSFLGLGVQPPAPDWSVMISDARMNFRSAPHLILVPGICVVALLFGILLIGDMLRDVFDKKAEEAGGYR